MVVWVCWLVEDLPGYGYKLYCDNYYSSIPFARELLNKNIFLVGTMRADSRVPSCIKFGTTKSQNQQYWIVRGAKSERLQCMDSWIILQFLYRCSMWTISNGWHAAESEDWSHIEMDIQTILCFVELIMANSYNIHRFLCKKCQTIEDILTTLYTCKILFQITFCKSCVCW